MRFFTSDLHVGHTNILKLGEGRPFEDLAHMHSTFMKNFWEIVTPEDDLYFLGDIAMGNFEESIKFIEGLPGRKFLVPGNHDKIFPKLNTETRIARFRPMYEAAGLTILPLWHEIEIEVDDVVHTVRLSHVPSSPERYPGRADKLAFARPLDDGKFLIHGHIHSKDKVSENPRELHVGVDANNWSPVSEDEIRERMRAVIAAQCDNRKK